MAQDNSVAGGNLPYRTKTVTLAAGGIQDIPGNIKFLTMITATNLSKVQVSFNGSSFSAFPPGFNLRDFEAEIFWLKNTDVAPNTVVVAIGQADLRDSRVTIDAANPMPVTISSGSVNATLTGAGANDADAEATKATGLSEAEIYPRVFNGATWDRLKGDATGGLWVQGRIADGAAHGAIGGHKPVLIGGTDGTNAQMLATDGNGYLKIIVGTGTLAVSGTVTATASGDYTCIGKAAHDAAIAGNPVRQGGRALTSTMTLVATGDTCDMITTLDGRQVVTPYAIPENHISAMITVTNNADNAIFAAQAAGVKSHITSVTLQNTNATAPGLVKIRDGTTDRWQVNLPASMTAPITFYFPTPIQVTAATALNILAATTGANILVSVTGYKGP
jgi:hypothetical protein